MGKLGVMPVEDREKLDRMRAKAVFRAMVKYVPLQAPAVLFHGVFHCQHYQ